MRKKLALLAGTVGIIALGVMMFSAFESYVLNIEAHVEPALNVFPNGERDLGNVFPEEAFDQNILVELSKSFQAEPNIKGVEYDIDCQSKPSTGLPNLCDNISVTVDGNGCDFAHIKGVLQTGTDLCRLSLNNPGNKADLVSLNWRIPDCIGAHQKDPDITKELDCGKQGIDVSTDISIQVTGFTGRVTKDIVTGDQKDQIFKFVAPDGGVWDRLVIGIGKLGQDCQIGVVSAGVCVDSLIHATIKDCDPATVKGEFKGHEKDANVDPEIPDHEFWGFTWSSKCIGLNDEVIVQATAGPDAVPDGDLTQLVIKTCEFVNTSTQATEDCQ